ncbi:branched-chain amino acid ABC transporter permease [Myxacorys almedinensis A]|uniref:Branched-chain amino acid ABC transporter permease n=1 Tax=Myxacorys almedinensis A TaxID=2690445 RepID=A0A8J7Z4N4_9CYAN|nr:branched-chain amino acid ABC transporter permease [Myxacorys almedinensis A]
MIGYLVFLITSVAVYGLFSLGLNLQWGYTGLINFGHVAFMTVGAYATTLLSLAGVPLLAAVSIGAVLAALLGLLMGFSTLRLREDYLAIVTIGTSELVRLVALNEGWLTKGAFGVQSFPLPLENFRPTVGTRIGMIVIISAIFGTTLWKLAERCVRQFRRAKTWQHQVSAIASGLLGLLAIRLWVVSAIALYDFRSSPATNGLLFIVLITVAIVFWALERLVKSPWGRVLKAIREDEEVAKALGKNVFAYKLQSLMLGGFIAGIAGAFFAWQLSTVYPTNFEPLVTFQAWIIMILGGAGNNAGTLLGAGIYWAYTALTRDLERLPIAADQVGALRIMVIGLILMVLMIWRPQGILGNKDELTLGK